MKHILAIDLKNGKVVKAFAGFRLNYKPLVLDKKDFSCPFVMISKVCCDLKIANIYIADLDAIEKKNSNHSLIFNLMKKFQKINFLLDLGFDYPSSIHKLCMVLKKEKLRNYNLVIGTETMKNYSIENFLIEKNIFFSIDFNGSEQNWIRKMYRKKNLNLILMFVKRTGGRGVDYITLRKNIKLFGMHNCFVAGGIREKEDLKKLAIFGASGVIVSNYIHKKIIRDNFHVPNNN